LKWPVLCGAEQTNTGIIAQTVRPRERAAVVRHFALNLVRQVVDKRSIKRRRKRAAWDPQYLLDTLGPLQPKPC
jgi:hypothetical protein